MTLEELFAAAKAAIEAGDAEKAEGLLTQVDQMKRLDALTPAPEPQETEAEKALKAKNAELEAFKARVEAEPPIAKAGVQVTMDETDKKASQPWRNVGEQMKAIANAALYPHAMDDRLKAQKAILGQNETVGSEGGFLLQSEFSEEVFRLMFEVGEIVPRCRSWPISVGNSTKINALKESSRADGSRYGGVNVYWVAEGSTITASSMDFRQIELNLNKMAAVTYATDEVLADTTQLQTLMTTVVPEAMSFEVENSIITGTGVGQPHGVLGSDARVSIAKESGQAATTLVAENVIKMWSRAWAKSRINAIWLINQDIEPQLQAMSLPVGTGGVSVYLPPTGLSQSPYSTLFGQPVIPVEYAKTLGTEGDIMLVDLNEYLLATKVNEGMRFDQSIHVQFLTDQMTFRHIFRVDGKSAWSTALTPLNGTNTLSPFVTTATRS